MSALRGSMASFSGSIPASVLSKNPGCFGSTAHVSPPSTLRARDLTTEPAQTAAYRTSGCDGDPVIQNGCQSVGILFADQVWPASTVFTTKLREPLVTTAKIVSASRGPAYVYTSELPSGPEMDSHVAPRSRDRSNALTSPRK